jgi:hypothetical protein
LFVASPQPTKGTPALTTKEPESEEITESPDVTPVYTLESHTSKKSREIVELFEHLREGILGLAEVSEISEKANKMYIGYRHGKNFCEVRLQAMKILICRTYARVILTEGDLSC